MKLVLTPVSTLPMVWIAEPAAAAAVQIRRVSLLGGITVYEKTETMMLSRENELIPWEEPVFVDQIPINSYWKMNCNEIV